VRSADSDLKIDVVMEQDLENGWVQSAHRMGFSWQGKEVLVHVASNTLYLGVMNSGIKKIEPLAKYVMPEISSQYMDVVFSGTYDRKENPLFFFTGKLFKFNLKTMEIEFVKGFSDAKGGFGGGLIRSLGVKKDDKELFLISTDSLGFDACVVAAFNPHSLSFEYDVTTSRQIMMSDRNSIIKTNKGNYLVAEQTLGYPNVYFLDDKKQEIQLIYKEKKDFVDRKSIHKVQLLSFDNLGNMIFTGIEGGVGGEGINVFSLNVNTGHIEEVAHNINDVLLPDKIVDALDVVPNGSQPLIAVISMVDRKPELKRSHLNLIGLDLKTGIAEHYKGYAEDAFGPQQFPEGLYFDPVGKTLVVQTNVVQTNFKKPLILGPLGGAFRGDGDFAMIHDNSQAKIHMLKLPIRTGFEALSSEEDLEGLPPLVKMVARFLKEENVALIQEEVAESRPSEWTVEGSIKEPISLALLNYFYDKKAKDIQSNPQIDFPTFLNWLQEVQGADISDYIHMIRSGIKGQDKTTRAWVREIAVQNARDALRRAREQGELEKESGEIAVRNFTEGDQWVFSVRDQGTGMDLWHLIRYFFPLDQSSKDHLQDSGNLGQGNYTLFADFDRVLLRTSTGNGIIQELEIENDDKLGPVITKWEVLKGNYKGSEVRRIKKQAQSDPQLESLFIQDALQKFAGAIKSPEEKRKMGLVPDVRDVRITYNGETFSEPRNVLETLPLGSGWGNVALERGDKTYGQRVIQDGIFIKTPDDKELKLIPTWLQMAFERFGRMHISLPREILLNIPRTGYAQEHKFLPRLQVAVLHGVMKTILRDYIEKGAKIPGEPPGYYSDENVQDNPQAQMINLLLYHGQYDQITEDMLLPFLKSPKDFFELLSHTPFVSDNHQGEASLNLIRENLIAESGLRKKRADVLNVAQGKGLSDIFSGTKLKGAFEKDMRFNAGGGAALTGASLAGALGERSAARSEIRKPTEDLFSTLPENAETFITYLSMRFLRPVVGNDMPGIHFYNKKEPVAAYALGEDIYWNLFTKREMFATLLDISGSPEKLMQEFQKGEEGAVWVFLETLIHESQHLPKFERPGDHTHHDAEKIVGFDSKNDDRFGVRMGAAIDEILFDLGDDILSAFSVSPVQMKAYIEENKAKKDASALNTHSKKSNKGGIDFKSDKVGGAFKIQGAGSGEINFNITSVLFEQLKNAPGFVPVIINIQPMGDLNMFLGLTGQVS